MARTKCPMCMQSTSTDEGACDFCGHELSAAIVEEARERAERLASPAHGREKPSEIPTAPRPPAAVSRGGLRGEQPPRHSDPSVAKTLEDAEQMATMSFALGLVSIFFLAILAPIAFWLARKSLRVYRENGVEPHWTASAGYWIGLVMSLLVGLALSGLVFLLVMIALGP